MYDVIEQNQTAAGKWQVRVVISLDETVFFSFPSPPTQKQVDTEAEILLLTRRIEELRRAAVIEE